MKSLKNESRGLFCITSRKAFPYEKNPMNFDVLNPNLVLFFPSS